MTGAAGDTLEAERLAAVERYAVLDTPRDGTFDRITRIASEVFDAPIAIISIVDEDRIWFKSATGIDGVDEIGRDPGLCASAILQDDVWLVEDARADPRTLANPLVAGDFGLQFYAGSPLRTSDGFRLGTVCVIDREPRRFGMREQQLLADLAAIVVDELELRLAARREVAAIDARRRHSAELNDDVVQSLATAKLSLELGDAEAGIAHVASAIESAKRVLADMSAGSADLRRSDGPASQ